MGKIKVTPCDIKGLYVIEPAVFKDERGYFMETYNQNDFKEAGLGMVFVQDNQSMSVKGVLRGLHFQKQYPQGKLVRVVRGTVYDVRWICVLIPKPTENGLASFFLQRIRSSFIYPKDLPMDSWCCPMKRNSLISARTSTIRETRAACCGATLKSGWTGP